MIPFLYTFLLLFTTIRKELKNPEFRALLSLVIFTLLSGTYVYHRVEGWNWLDSLYFSVITLTTVGYGDLSPHSGAGKIFTIIYIFVGLGLLMAFVTLIGEQIVEHRLELQGKKRRKKKRHKDRNSEIRKEPEAGKEI